DLAGADPGRQVLRGHGGALRVRYGRGREGFAAGAAEVNDAVKNAGGDRGDVLADGQHVVDAGRLEGEVAADGGGDGVAEAPADVFDLDGAGDRALVCDGDG